MAICERCTSCEAIKGCRYCKSCKKEVLREMKDAGYLQTLPFAYSRKRRAVETPAEKRVLEEPSYDDQLADGFAMVAAEEDEY